MSVNVKGTENILNAIKCDQNFKKFIYASTANVYGDQEVPMSEASPTEPIDFYAQTKLEAENKILKYKTKMPIAIARMSNVYGPNQKDFAVVPRLIKEIKNSSEGKEITVGKATRDFIYIDDVIEAMLIVAEKGEEVYNLGVGRETSIKSVAQIITNYLNKSLTIKEKQFSEMERSYLNIKKIRSLGWKPKYNLNEMLEKILEHE